MSAHFTIFELVTQASHSRTRAPHLPPQERRAALIAATRDALIEHGCVPTTRQIAEHAGVAEGTIFRIFDSKESLVEAVVADSFDQAPLTEEIAGIDPVLPLRARLYRLVEITQTRFQRIIGLMDALGTIAPPPAGNDPGAEAENKAALEEQFRAVIGEDVAQLSVSATEALQLLRLLTFSGSHPRISEGNTLTAQRIVDVLLDGISAKPADRTIQ